MSEWLPPLPSLFAFLIASLVLAITPGPAVLYIVNRSLSQGGRAGLASVAGVAFGNFGNVIGAALGLAAIFALSSAAFAIVKYAGAAYLIYLGVQALRAAEPVAPVDEPAPKRLARIVGDGFIVALLNPKTALFFAAFLPQFMSTATAHAAQSVVLGACFVVIAAITDTLYALAAGALAPRLAAAKNLPAWGRYGSGALFIGLGVCTALAGARKP
jgi:threonine/homoserine/homoserine lactone efflux protein